MHVMERHFELDRPPTPESKQATSHEQEAIEVLFLGASFGAGNMGINALACGTVASALHAFPKAQLRFLDYGYEPAVHPARCNGSRVQVQLVNLRFSKKLFLENNIARLLLTALAARLIPSGRAKKRWLSKNRYLKQILEADIITSIAGGDSFSDIYGVVRFLYVTLPQILIILLGKPLVLLPQTYGPYERGIVKTITRWILSGANIVYSRDAAGVKVVEDLIGRDSCRVKFAYDMGFALEPTPPSLDVLAECKKIQCQAPVVGLNISGLLFMGGYSRKNMFGLKADYREAIKAILDFLIFKQKVQVILIPHVFGEGAENDVSACETLFTEYQFRYNGWLHYFRHPFDQHEIKFIIGQCDLFIGSRMHACIAALSQCVPAVGLAYSQKFAGVLDSVGGGSCVVDLREADIADIVLAVERSFVSRSVLRNELVQRMPAIKNSVLDLFSSPEFQRAAKL